MPNKLKRREDWPELLAHFVQTTADQVFRYGQQDCCLFACDWVRTATGVDLAADFRGRYSDLRGAKRVMKSFAGGGVKEVAEKIASLHGIEEVPVLTARRGDVVLLDSPATGCSMAIVDTDGMHAVAPGLDGLVRVPIELCLKAWRI